ncbi:2-hydroxyacyl-CoA dehydratase [Thermodesulfobacteriota bacterium]
MLGYHVTKGAASKSKKRLRTSAAVQAYHKKYFLKAHDRVKQGEPFVFAGVSTPHEILEAMNIPYVVSPWWAAINVSKRLTGYYMDMVDKERIEKGYDLLGQCSRCGGNVAWARLADKNPMQQAYGGLPKLTAIIESEPPCLGTAKATEIQIREYRQRGFDVPIFIMERAAPPPYHPDEYRWWEKIVDHWDEVIKPHRLDYRVEELKALIKFLEVTTGRTFSQDRLIEVMELENEQEMWWRKARDLIAETSPAPIDLVDQLAQYPSQWHRGSTEARDLAKLFYKEVKERVDQGKAAYPEEKLRLQWLTGGNFGNTAFYQYFADKYKAVFVCSVYLSISADGYPRSLLGDPLRALAGRHILLGLYTGPEWDLKEARLHRVNGALVFDYDCPLRVNYGRVMYKQAYEAAGIPLFEIPRSWNAEKQKTEISKWIETHLID